MRPGSDVGRLVMLILNDPSLSERDKQNALEQLQRLPSDSVRSLLLSAAGGALSGAVLASMVGGRPLLGAAAGGFLGPVVGRNFFQVR